MRTLLKSRPLRFIAAVFAAVLFARTAHAGAPIAVEFPGADGLTLRGALYMPTGAGPFPAVVAMHGCGGLGKRNGQLNARHRDWGERLSAQGFVVLFPDSFGSRGLRSQCRITAREVRPSRERVADAAASRAYLAGLPHVKAKAISLLGWSNGGSTVLYTVEPRHAPHTGSDFARAVAFYPGCRVPLAHGAWRTRVPLLVLIGRDDDWTPAGPCVSLVEAAKAAGQNVEIVTYAGAYHDFDHPDLPVHEVHRLAYTGTGTGTAHTGTNAAARADAIKRVPAFLAR